MGDFLFILGGFGHLLDFRNDGINGFFNAALDIHRVGTGGYVFYSFTKNSLGQNSSRGRAVPGIVTGFAGDLVDHLRAHVFKRVLQFNFLSHCNTVFGDGGGTEFFVNHHVAPFRTQGDFYGICQLINSRQYLMSSGFIIYDLFSHKSDSPYSLEEM